MGNEDNEKRKEYRQWGLLSTIGITLVASTCVGLAIGYYLDKWLGTKPLFIIIWTILGVAAGFKEMFSIIKKGE
ncbi:MAG: AtpZ/AtpI family protein [Candidatus Schekmanbacteria bacterium]|nr:MAG: AtpZ/AtpI family protein [Candidatus Schekmanbacteria bacterium]